VKYRITESKFLKAALPLRDIDGRNEASPYNLPVYRLASEVNDEKATKPQQEELLATLHDRVLHTEDIATFTFRLNHPQRWKAGQHVLLDVSQVLEKPPGSVIKTFTVSSAPLGVDGPKDFDITIRRVGIATTALFEMSPGAKTRVAGFAGEFIPGIVGTESQEEIRFVAGGLGITPFLAIVASKQNAKLRLWWAVREKDMPFVENILRWLQRNGVANDRVRVFVSGDGRGDSIVMDSSCQIQRRRITMDDLGSYKMNNSGIENHWWICAPNALREHVLGWVEKIGGKGEWEIFEY